MLRTSKHTNRGIILRNVNRMEEPGIFNDGGRLFGRARSLESLRQDNFHASEKHYQQFYNTQPSKLFLLEVRSKEGDFDC